MLLIETPIHCVNFESGFISCSLSQILQGPSTWSCHFLPQGPHVWRRKDISSYSRQSFSWLETYVETKLAFFSPMGQEHMWILVLHIQFCTLQVKKQLCRQVQSMYNLLHLHFDRCTYFFLPVWLLIDVLLRVIFSSCITSEVSGPGPTQMNVRHLLGFRRAMSNLNVEEVERCWGETLLKAS